MQLVLVSFLPVCGDPVDRLFLSSIRCSAVSRSWSRCSSSFPEHGRRVSPSTACRNREIPVPLVQEDQTRLLQRPSLSYARKQTGFTESCTSILVRWRVGQRAIREKQRRRSFLPCCLTVQAQVQALPSGPDLTDEQTSMPAVVRADSMHSTQTKVASWSPIWARPSSPPLTCLPKTAPALMTGRRVQRRPQRSRICELCVKEL